MLTIEEKTILAIRWHRYFESLIYVECLAHGIRKTPVLELKPDDGSYQHPDFRDASGKLIPGTIHIGYGQLEAETDADLFDQIHHLLGHEMQHLLSTTDKDWEAAQMLCFRDACQRLSVRVFGRTRRLVKDSDYEQFFKDLAAKGIFVNQKMLGSYVKFVLNVLEDGRIENIRTRKHPGFGKYRKVFRGKRWLSDDFRDADFFTEDPDDLDKLGELMMLMSQIYPLATLGIYQKGFLASYGGTKAHDMAAGFIPEISRAVIAPTCKECMDQGRIIFARLLDRIIDVCTIEADAKEFEKFLQALLSRLLEDLEKMQMSASPKTEEKGDGLPAESILGDTELEIEVDKETYEKLMEEADDEESAGVRIKCREEPGEESSDDGESEGGESGNDSEGSETGESTASNGSSESAEESGYAASESSEEDTEDSGASGSSDESSGDAGSDDGKSDDGEKSGDASGDTDSNGGTETSTEISSGSDSTGHNNIVDSAEECRFSEEEALEMLEKAMAEAAKASKQDLEFAEADAKTDEEFSKAAAKFKAVSPAPISLASVDSKYREKVRFVEKTRKYDPTLRLSMELENKGKSLDRKVDQLVKNKMDPDQRFLKSGLLDTRRLANLAMGEIDVFKKKGEPVKTEVAAFLLMDNSGSMGCGPGSTRNACCNAFAVLEEGFKKHMPLKIAAFDAGGTNFVTHEVIKEFDEVAPSNLAYNFRDLGRSGGGNKDGYSIRVAAKQLSERPEKDKLLIIASDGFPTDYSGGFEEGIKDVKDAVNDARKAGIRTIGMYMYHRQSDEDFATYREMYGDEIIFASLDEIEDELTRILQRYFH